MKKYLQWIYSVKISSKIVDIFELLGLDKNEMK